MKDLKKAVALLLAASMMIAVIACDSGSSSDGKKKKKKDRDREETEIETETETETETEAPTWTTAESTDETTEETTEGTTAATEPSVTEPPVTEPPVTEPDEGDKEMLFDKALEDLLCEWKEAKAMGFDYDESIPDVPWYSYICVAYDDSTAFWGRYDFNGDGQDEVVIAAGYDHEGGGCSPIAIYAFNGEKFVYLCDELPLGGRTSIAYDGGDTITLVGADGAARGIVVKYTIGDDGFSTVIVDRYVYEYQEDGSVEITVEEGTMTLEQFDFDLIYGPFEADIDYEQFI